MRYNRLMKSAIELEEVNLLERNVNEMESILEKVYSFARHYKPRLVHFLPQFLVRFIIKSG